MIILHDPACAQYASPGHPERPERVLATAARFRTVFPHAEWRVPPAAGLADVLRAHTPEHLERLSHPPDFDGDTPFHPGIREHALRAAGAAVLAARLALEGEHVFSLMRPPGHHACRNEAMGFCYLNSIAIAALAARAAGVDRVAIWDFDAHHGNGTEEIVLRVPGVRFASVHQYPGYPGTGRTSRDNCFNWTVSPADTRHDHRDRLAQSWEKILAFRPQLILVSAGFDAYAGDPLTALRLEGDDFAELGRWRREAKIPSAAVLEGGYSHDLPLLKYGSVP